MTKAADLREKGEGDLQIRERDLSDQLFKLRFQRATGSLENPAKMRQVRREIARIKTIRQEKQAVAASTASSAAPARKSK